MAAATGAPVRVGFATPARAPPLLHRRVASPTPTASTPSTATGALPRPSARATTRSGSSSRCGPTEVDAADRAARRPAAAVAGARRRGALADEALAAGPLRRAGEPRPRTTFGGTALFVGTGRGHRARHGGRRPARAARAATSPAGRRCRSWPPCSRPRDAMLANDTGPLHLAAALGRPCVAPYTCTEGRPARAVRRRGRRRRDDRRLPRQLPPHCAHGMVCMAELTAATGSLGRSVAGAGRMAANSRSA